MVEKPKVDSCVADALDEWKANNLLTAKSAPATPPVVLKPKAPAPVIAEKQEHLQTNSNCLQDEDLSAQEAYIADAHTPELSFAESMPWKSWKEVPEPDALPAHLRRGFFLEMFAGTAHLTLAMRVLGVLCLPPIEKSWGRVVRALRCLRALAKDPKMDPSRTVTHAPPWNRTQNFFQGPQA